MRRMKRVAFMCSVLCVLPVAGCGGSGSDSGEDAEVRSLLVDDDSLDVGEGTVAHVNFSFDESSVFDDRDHIVVVVRLDPELHLRDRTSELTTTGNDKRVTPVESFCSLTGETYLEYDFDRNDLEDVISPDGDANAELKLTVDTLGPRGASLVAATADNNGVPFRCGDSFFAEESLEIEQQ